MGNKNTGFKLKNMNDIFAVTDTREKSSDYQVYELSVDKLHAFRNHPFKLYEGQRFEDMVKSSAPLNIA